MEIAAQLKRGISRQFSTGSLRLSGKLSFNRQSSMDPRRNALRFSFGRQSSLDPIRRSPGREELTVPENLDMTMQLLFMACRGDVKGVEDLLNEGVDVNSIDLDGRTALHIAACEGHVEVVKLLLIRKANIDARDRWGSTAAADAKYYGNDEVYNILKARGAKVPKTRKTPMVVSNPREVPEYEINPLELQLRRADGITKGAYQVAKWNGTKVSVKILDKDFYTDPESINAFKHELTLLEKGDLGNYLQKKGRLQASKVLRFALDIARGMNCLHECKPDPIIHCDLRPKNILLDNGGLLKVAGFGLIELSKISQKKVKLAQSRTQFDSNLYVAPEVYKDQIFEKSVDTFSFGLVLYEMIEGAPPFHPKSAEDVAKMICLEGMRPPLKLKSKSYPSELKELVEECWNSDASLRPTFKEIIVRLDKIVANCSKQGWWKETFKLPWK
ncbi:dual specificity protein kinase shkC [Cinnamomum micranthum f. kanehirae]|uniref:non-specific serine/threonine protein kinase n=1 Tax=Cinnamomum micranthum f. kanehirae TaxID=337451 RepID=A0A3S3PSC5_9MAGN|nr:dual specificity protein kinase shkC [Cinnamomum micranthum f. kanehirae]